MNKSINILGTEYKIIYQMQEDNPKFDEVDGYVDNTTKEIYIMIQRSDKSSVKNIKHYQDHILKHEIIHAFLYESGLDAQTHNCDSWATNEEMVDWLAIQFNKIQKVFKELKI